MSVSVAASALYKSLPWRLSGLALSLVILESGRAGLGKRYRLFDCLNGNYFSALNLCLCTEAALFAGSLREM